MAQHCSRLKGWKKRELFSDRPFHNRGDERFINVWMSTSQHHWKSIKSFMDKMCCSSSLAPHLPSNANCILVSYQPCIYRSQTRCTTLVTMFVVEVTAVCHYLYVVAIKLVLNLFCFVLSNLKIILISANVFTQEKSAERVMEN